MNIGLCKGRHVMKTNKGKDMDFYLFDVVDKPIATDVHEKVCREFINNFLYSRTTLRIIHDYDDYEDFNLYITGLTPLLTSFLKCWVERQDHVEMDAGSLVLWHWDTEVKQYIPQKWAVIT